MMMMTKDSPCIGHKTLAEHDEFLDALADMVVVTAFRAHPDDPQAAIECALSAVTVQMVPAVQESCKAFTDAGAVSDPAETLPVIGRWTVGLHGDEEGQAARDLALIEENRL